MIAEFLPALKLFDRVVVAIMINPDKKGRFSFAQRKRIAELTLADIPEATVITADGYLADLAAALKAVAIVKGVRNSDDFVYEQEMAEFNHKRNNVTESVFLSAFGENVAISSTAARYALDNKVPLDGLIAPEAVEYIESIVC